MAKLIDITGKVISGEWGNDDETGQGIPVLRTTNFTNVGVINFSNVITRDIKKTTISDKFLRKGDIIIEKSGGSDKQPVGRVVYFEAEENKYLFNNFTGLLRILDNSVCYSKYLFYALFSNYQRGATIPYQNKTTGLHNLKTDDYVKKCDIPLPSLEEQKKIAANLDKVTHTIDLCNQILEKLDLLVKARFVEMFGEPILNPKGWKMVTIGDIVTEVKYGTSRPAVDGGKFPYLRMNNLTYDGHLDLTDLKRIDIPDNELEKCIVHKGDVLFNRTNSVELVGKTCVFNELEDMVIAGYIIRLRLKQNMLPLVLSCFMNTDTLKERLRNMAKGAVNQANINAQELQRIEIYIPPIELQKQFADFVEKTDKSKLAVKKMVEKTETLKKALMQEYFK